MPPRYAFRLEDLRVFHFVRASCLACGHKAIIPNAALLQGRPGYTRLMSLDGSCGAKDAGREGRPRSKWNYGRAIEIEGRGNMAGACRRNLPPRRSTAQREWKCR